MRQKSELPLRILKWVAGSVIAFLVLIVAAAFVLVSRPELLINDRNLEIAARYVRRHEILDVQWKTAHVQIESLALLHKRIKFQFEELCMKKAAHEGAGTSFSGCLGKVEVSVAASFAGFKPQITEIGPLSLSDGHVDVLVRAEPLHSTPPQDALEGNGIAVPGFLRGTRIFPINIELKSFKIAQVAPSVNSVKGREEDEGATQSGSFHFRSFEEGTGAARMVGEFKLENRVFGPDSRAARPTRLQANLDLLNPKGFWELGAWKAKLDAHASLPDGSRVSVDGDVKAREGSGSPLFDYQLDGEFDRQVKIKGQGRAVVTGRASGVAGPDRVDANITATARGMVPNIPVISVRDCKVGIARATTDIGGGTAQTECPVRLTIPLPPKGFPDLKMPTEVGVRVVADLKTGSFPPSADSLLDGKVTLEIDPILSPIFEGEGKIQSHLAGIPIEFPNGWVMDTDLGLKLRIPSFQKLVAQLANTPWDVWAPARVLEGEVALAVEGKFDAQQGTAPLKLRTRLVSQGSQGSGKKDSSGQKLNIDAAGALTLERIQPSPKMHLQMDVALSDVQLQVPPLPEPPSPTHPGFDMMPRFFPDSRIHAPINKFQKKPNSMLTYEVNITTPNDRPLQLKTRLAETPIPVAVQLALRDDAPPSGKLGVRAFPAKLFNKQVKLKRFNLALQTPTNESPLDGEITVPFGDYIVSVLVLGTVGKPVVRMRSDPPLPEDQILAVLLYGKPLESLDPDQTSSVGNANAALVSGALNLFSLYTLSSLPIQRIDWDPSTGNASIAVTLGEGTSLRLNQEEGERSVGIRRRITKHWAVTTQLNNPSDPTDRSVTALLEWAYQY